MNEKLLRIKDVKNYVPISTSGIYKKMSELKFPLVCKIGGTAFWKLSEIQKYINEGDNYISENTK